jgi:uncharacterized membrane protein YebE (DUF533 family)
MVQAPELITRLIRSALRRGEGVEPTNPQTSEIKAPASAPPARAQDATAIEPLDPTHSTFDPGILGVVAEKVLLAWLRNRYQLLFPFALNLHRLDKKQAELLVHAMIAAAHADGSLDGKERERIRGILNLVDASEAETALLEEAIIQPKPLNDILTEVRDVQTGALVYAASLMALDQRKAVNRHYLRYLAARLQLSDELVESLDHRYRSAS